MRNIQSACIIVGLGLLLPLTVNAEDQATRNNRLRFSPRAGFNVSARFDGIGSGGSPRTTPNGDPYNYDDGYVLTDISGNQGGQTWYWGYDDSAAQVSGNNIVLNSTTVTDGTSPLSENADPSIGGELVYNMDLGSRGPFRYGFEAAASYQNIRVNSSALFSATLTTMTDSYSFTSGSTPPPATPSSPYQGTHQGPGFLINASPSSSTSTDTPGVVLSSENELRSDLWGVRVGPYFEFPINETVSLALSGGVEAGLLHSTVSWRESGGAYSSMGEDDNSAALAGFYLAGTVSWRFAERWSLVGGVQFHNLGVYKDTFQGRGVELDLTKSIFTTLGASWSF